MTSSRELLNSRSPLSLLHHRIAVDKAVPALLVHKGRFEFLPAAVHGNIDVGQAIVMRREIVLPNYKKSLKSYACLLRR